MSNYPGYPQGGIAVGAPVVANWQGRGMWYGGYVRDVQSGGVLVHYLDGDQEWVTWDRVSPPRLLVGLRVLARWQNFPIWYPGVVRGFQGNMIAVQYLDGDQEWADPSRVRFDDIGVNDWVMADLEGVRRYVPGRVVGRSQDGLLIQLLDGRQARVSMQRVGLGLEARTTGRPNYYAPPM